MLNRVLFTVFLLLLLLVSAGFTTYVLAIDTSSALWTGRVNIINLGIDEDNIGSAQVISGAALIDSGFMEADTLNAVIHQGTNLIAGMPPNNRIAVEGAVSQDGAVFTEFTTEAANDTVLDVVLLPITPAVADAHYFGFHNPARILSINIGQEGIGDWTLDWEYWNGTAFTALSNVVDNSSAFKTPGLQAISWDMPSDFATSTITGSAVDAFWVRAVVDSVTTSSQQAIGTQEFYENGQWWMWVFDIDQNDQIQFDLSMGGPDLVTRQQVFVGEAGVLTADDATMELGDTYAVVYQAMLNVTAGVTGSDICLVCKTGAFHLILSDDDEVTLTITGGGTTTLSVDGITVPVTGSHTVNIFSDGTDVTLEVVGFGSATGTAQAMVDNANGWEFASNFSTIYIDAITLATPGVLSRFNSEADWSSGTLVGTSSEAGSVPPDPNLNTLVEISTEDVNWWEGTSAWFDTRNETLLGNETSVGATNGAWSFSNIDLDQGETVSTAIIEFSPFSTGSNTTVNLQISAIDEDDADICTSFAACEALVTTATTGSWSSVPTFTQGTTINSIDIADIIQEVVDRAGWVNGNDIVIVIEDSHATPSSTNAFRSPAAADDNRSAARLILTVAAGDLPPDDFVALEQTGSTTADDDNPFGWTKDRTRGASSSDGGGKVEGIFVQFGANSFKNFGDTSASGVAFTEDGLGQVLTASAGQVWSFSIYSTKQSSVNDADPRFQINWQDSDSNVLATVEVNIPLNGNTDRVLTEINGETAPASTAFVEVRMYARCSSVFGCQAENETIRWDGVMACICASAATFPDSSNLLVNPSFEEIYTDTGTWVSTTANPTATNVLFATASWDALVPANTTLLAETSIDGQSTWQAIANGGNIAGIAIGDDLSSTTIHLRFTLASSDQRFSPIVGLATINITDFDEASMRYALATTPGVTLDDVSDNANLGTMSYPVASTSIFSTMGSLTSTRVALSQRAAIGDPSFASDVSNALTGSAVSTNIFGDETGSDLPFFGILSDSAVIGDVPVQVLWTLLVIMLTVMGGAWVFKSTTSLLFAGIFMGASMVFAGSIGSGLIPVWTVFLYIVIFTALLALRPKLAP